MGKGVTSIRPFDVSGTGRRNNEDYNGMEMRIYPKWCGALNEEAVENRNKKLLLCRDMWII